MSEIPDQREEQEEILGKLEERREHYSKWLERFAKADRIAPYVQQGLETTEWEIEALRQSPDEAIEVPFPTSAKVYRLRNEYLSESLPMLHDYTIPAMASTIASTSAGSASTYGWIAQLGDLDIPHVQEYSKKYTMQYWQIQENQSRPWTVRALLQRLGNPQTIQRFDRALKAYQATKTGTGERTAAAGDMRTLLYGIHYRTLFAFVGI
jgi:hypothetical protein